MAILAKKMMSFDEKVKNYGLFLKWKFDNFWKISRKNRAGVASGNGKLSEIRNGLWGSRNGKDGHFWKKKSSGIPDLGNEKNFPSNPTPYALSGRKTYMNHNPFMIFDEGKKIFQKFNNF